MEIIVKYPTLSQNQNVSFCANFTFKRTPVRKIRTNIPELFFGILWYLSIFGIYQNISIYDENIIMIIIPIFIFRFDDIKMISLKKLISIIINTYITLTTLKIPKNSQNTPKYPICTIYTKSTQKIIKKLCTFHKKQKNQKNFKKPIDKQKTLCYNGIVQKARHKSQAVHTLQKGHSSLCTKTF